MKTEDLKTLADAIKELNESYMDLVQSMSDTTREARAARNLWRKGNSPILVKIGLALIAFPDPTISDVVGAALVAAGTVQMGIRRRTLYIENVYKTFHSTLKGVWSARRNL